MRTDLFMATLEQNGVTSKPPLVSIRHESGNLAEYTITSVGGGDLSVSPEAALAGSNYGLSCLVNDTGAIYGQKTVSVAVTGILRWRYYLDVNSLTMANNDQFMHLQLYDSENNTFGAVEMIYILGTGYRLHAKAVNDAGTALNTVNYTISDAPHYIEVKLLRASSAVSSDGSIEIWVDGASAGSITGIDNYDRAAYFSHIRFGAVSGLDAGTNGTFYLDELILNDTGTLIGEAR